MIPLAIALFVGICVFYYAYNPATTPWTPKCVVYSLTHYRCPGCGMQRLLYHTLHGEFREAISYNYFFPIGVVYCILLSLIYLFPSSRFAQKSQEVFTSKESCYVYLILYVAWWILRNIFNL